MKLGNDIKRFGGDYAEEVGLLWSAEVDDPEQVKFDESDRLCRLRWGRHVDEVRERMVRGERPDPVWLERFSSPGTR